jgi:hypothetical protein
MAARSGIEPEITLACPSCRAFKLRPDSLRRCLVERFRSHEATRGRENWVKSNRVGEK